MGHNNKSLLSSAEPTSSPHAAHVLSLASTPSPSSNRQAGCVVSQRAHAGWFSWKTPTYISFVEHIPWQQLFCIHEWQLTDVSMSATKVFRLYCLTPKLFTIELHWHWNQRIGWGGLLYPTRCQHIICNFIIWSDSSQTVQQDSSQMFFAGSETTTCLRTQTDNSSLLRRTKQRSDQWHTDDGRVIISMDSFYTA